MSKMSEIAMELDDQAIELGFESYEEAIAKGYDVCYGEEGAYLYKPQPEDEQLKAHKAWLKEKEQVLNELKSLIEFEDFQEKMLGDEYVDTGEKEILKRACDFIKKGEM